MATDTPVRLGVIGLGPMGANLVRRLIATALTDRFESRGLGLGEFADRVLSAMRSEFGGHAEKRSRP